MRGTLEHLRSDSSEVSGITLKAEKQALCLGFPQGPMCQQNTSEVQNVHGLSGLHELCIFTGHSRSSRKQLPTEVAMEVYLNSQLLPCWLPHSATPPSLTQTGDLQHPMYHPFLPDRSDWVWTPAVLDPPWDQWVSVTSAAFLNECRGF